MVTSLQKLRENKSYANYLFADSEIVRDDFSSCTKIAVLRNYTVELMIPILRGEVALCDNYPEIYLGDFDAIYQDVLDGESGLHKFAPDIICLCIDLRIMSPKLAMEYCSMKPDEIKSEEMRILSFVKGVLDKINADFSSSVIVHNFIDFGVPSYGILDAQLDISETRLISELNDSIYDLCRRYKNVFMLDLNHIVSMIGYGDAFDCKAWEISKNPFTKRAMMEIGQEYGKFLKVLMGNIKKCIVLDCDNTLWGGIVGEDGWNGIKIGKEYPGVCYRNLQFEILNLYHRGILIALCSKNNEEDVLEVFQKNKEMVISLDNIITYQINWESKADNLRNIAKSLNIGIDSLVFVDDNEFECNLIREQLPEVDVVQLDGSPSNYASLIRKCGLFNSLSLTEDDFLRNENYRADKQRAEMKENALTLEDYLRGLALKATVKINRQEDIPRLSQMTQKTNQFNLTTRRYGEGQIKKFMEDENADVIAIALEDKFSNLGIIGLAIICYKDRTAVLDSFLLSCRALGRHVEDALFAQVTRACLWHGCEYFEGSYLRSKKNHQVADLLTRWGLEKKEETETGDCYWQGVVQELQSPEYIKVVYEEDLK